MLIRSLLFACTALLIAIVTVNTSVVGQDKVERRDRKSEKAIIISGKITEESPAGFKISVGGAKDTVIPAADVLRVYYDDMPIALKQTYYGLFLKDETEKDPAKLLKEYQDFYAKASLSADVKVPVKRYLDYRIAMLKVAAAADTDEAKGDARRALETFALTHKIGWEVPFINRALAKMQLDRQDYEGALKTLNDLVNNATVPEEIRQEADLLMIEAMFQAGKIDAVKAKIEKAIADTKTSESQKSRFKIYLVGLESQSPEAKLEDTIKKLDAVIAQAADPGTKALAYNVMGDVYALKNMPRDAMWSYLWVDVVYSQDKAEHLKALTKLYNYFEKEKDAEKMQLYKEKIARMK